MDSKIAKGIKIPRLNLTKKKILIGLGVLVATLLAAYTTYSVLAWRNYDRETSSWIESAGKDLNYTLQAPIDDKSTAKDKRASTTKIAGELSEQSAHLCDPPPLTGWQEVLNVVKVKLDSCNEGVSSLKNEASELYVVLQFLNAEAQLAEVINRSIEKSSDLSQDEAKWGAASEVWREASSEVATLNGGDKFDAVIGDAEQRLDKIAAAWKALDDASKDESQAKFNSARAGLSDAYDDLQELDSIVSDSLGI